MCVCVCVCVNTCIFVDYNRDFHGNLLVGVGPQSSRETEVKLPVPQSLTPSHDAATR